MKYIKTFEHNKFDIKSGEYVLVDFDDGDYKKSGESSNINLVIGKCCGYSRYSNDFEIKYSVSDVFKNGKRLFIDRDNIKYHSKNKKDAEEYKEMYNSSKKYNI